MTSRSLLLDHRATQMGLGLAWAFAFVIGAWGVAERLLEGHHAANYGSYVVWGLWVAAYIYFIGLSAGAFLISSLVYVFRVRALERIGKLSLFVAVITLVMALLSIWFDLGHMGRFFYVYLHPNFHSMMAWMVWLYTAYFLLLLAELWWALRPDLVHVAKEGNLQGRIARWILIGKTEAGPDLHRRSAKVLRVLGAIGIPLAIAFHGGVGALFATVVARPYWHTPLYPILFLTGALVSGGALLTATVAFFWPRDDRQAFREMVGFLGRVVVGLLLFDLILEWAEYSIPMWYGVGPEFELLRRVLFGEFWWVFWILHILVGTLIPLALILARPRSPIAVGTGSFLVALTYMAVRLNIVVPALVEPELKGLEHAYRDHRLVFHYVPSLFEWQVVLFIVALGFAMFYLGLRWLPLTRDGIRNA